MVITPLSGVVLGSTENVKLSGPLKFEHGTGYSDGPTSLPFDVCALTVVPTGHWLHHRAIALEIADRHCNGCY
jgi:hypothetical protein